MKKWITKTKKLINTSIVFKHFIYERESQDTGNKGNFDVIKCANWVNVVALDSKRNFILVKQYRHGSDELTLEIPGGAIDPGEDRLLAAKRELREETGYTSHNWKKIGTVHPNPAFIDNFCDTYLALDCEKTHEQSLDPLEEVAVELVAESEIKRKVKQDEITHSLVIAAFYFYSLNEQG